MDTRLRGMADGEVLVQFKICKTKYGHSFAAKKSSEEFGAAEGVLCAAHINWGEDCGDILEVSYRDDNEWRDSLEEWATKHANVPAILRASIKHNPEDEICELEIHHVIGESPATPAVRFAAKQELRKKVQQQQNSIKLLRGTLKRLGVETNVCGRVISVTRD